MQPLNLSTAVGDIEIVVELQEGSVVATVLVTMPGGIRVHHSLDVSRLLTAGLSVHDTLDQTLQSVAMGVYATGLQRIDPLHVGKER